MKLKKFILCMLIMTLFASMCGCKAEQETKEPDSENSISDSEDESEPEPEPEPDPKTMPEYHSAEAVRERGVLTIGVSGNSPLTYIIPEDPGKYGELAGTRDGYISAMCRRIAEELGVQAEFVQYVTLEEQLKAVEVGDVDLAADNFMINEERLAVYEMTVDFNVTEIRGDEVFLSTNPQPWLPPVEEGSENTVEPVPGVMIQSEEELAHARIGVLMGSAQAINTAAQYPEAELYEFAGNNDILQALSAGQIDAGVFSNFDKEFADQIVNEIINGTVAQCGYEIEIRDFQGNGLILMKGNKDLCESINLIISELRESGWLLECYNIEEAEVIERGIR